MTPRSVPFDAPVELAPASAGQGTVVENLFQLYLYDFSDWAPLRPGLDGRFPTPDLSANWARSDHHPFLIYFHGQLAGFVLMDSEVLDPRSQFNVSHFFVARPFQRHGVGRMAAHDLFGRFPGRWEVTQAVANEAAMAFWRTLIAEYCGSYEELEVEIQGVACVQQRFDTRAQRGL